MKLLFTLGAFLFGISAATAVLHSLHYINTGSSGVPGLPEFVAVGLLDGRPFTYYDSNTKQVVPRQEWIRKSEGPDYWTEQTRAYTDEEHEFKADFEAVKQQFNHTGGVHTLQRMFGCDWDNETGKLIGYDRYGYDGEDFISLNSTTMMWVNAKQQAVTMTQEWNKDPHDRRKIYITDICPQVLKNYVSSAGASLRKVSPTVSLLQKTPVSPVTCLATGFYPDRANVSWRRDGGEPQVDMEIGQILPNNDGTFQMSAHLDTRSVRPEDWRRFSCVFQFSGEEENITTILDTGAIRTNWKKSHWMSAVITFIVVGVLAAFVVAIIYIVERITNCLSSSSRSSSDKKGDTTKESEPTPLKTSSETTTATPQIPNGGMKNGGEETTRV